MARYIDADKVLDDMLCEMAGTGYQAMAMNVIKYAETADVVPENEYEQLKRNLEQCENGYRQQMHLLQCKLADAENKVREIFEEIENKFYYDDVGDFTIDHMDFQALKKKYTEGEHDGTDCISS